MADENNAALSAPVESTEEEIIVERVDETPEADRNAQPATPETYTSVDDESQDAAYGQKVQSRIKQLRHVYHEQRRQREQAERDRDALVQYAQAQQQENARLRDLVSSSERIVLDQASGRAAAEIAQAREQLRRAHESDNADEIVKAQEALSRAVASHERYSSMRPTRAEQQPQQPQQQAQPQQAPAAPAAPMYPQQPQAPQQPQQRDERMDAWAAEHPWWNAPTTAMHSNAKRYLGSLHQELMQNGVLPYGPTVDAYWSTVDQQLSEVFPTLVSGSGGGNAPHANGQALNGRSSEQTRSRPVTVTSGNRGSATQTKVRLSDSELRIAQKLGVKPEDYAREKLKLQRAGQR